jgi:hypothetical protein
MFVTGVIAPSTLRHDLLRRTYIVRRTIGQAMSA